jgi:type II secretory pathway component GspD/PulD (secretin)
LFASNNKKASLISGQRVAVITGVLSGAGVGTTGLTSQNQVQYIDVNLSLEVVPLINSDKEVHLDIVQNIAEITSTTQIKQGNEVNDYPVISNRQIQTAVTVPNEGTLILGGLIKQTQDKSTAGVPFLSKAPLIGPLFRSTTASKKRTELVIMIRPSVALNNRDAIEVRDRNMRQMQIPANLEDGLGIETYRSSISDDPSSKFRVNPVVVSPGDPRGVYSTPPPTPPPAVIPVVSDPSKASKGASKGASNAAANQQKR